MGLFAGSVLAAAALLAGSGAPPDFAARVDRAVMTSDAAALEALRAELLAALKTPGAPARLRYDAAYVCWRLSHQAARTDEGRKEDLLSEAEEHLDVLIEAFPDDAEALALRGSAIGGRIDGMFSGMYLGPSSGRNFDKAMALAPDNPRIVLLKGVSQRFSPKSFGGGIDRAVETLRRAVGLFEAESAQGRVYPRWGAVDALAWLGIVLAAKGEHAEALATYQRALALEPDNAWIREHLIPELKGKRR